MSASAPLYWPTRIFFYPIGNTAAVCLTQDLPPGRPADVLLLGCGDVRNVLYTVYADLPSPAGPRQLDFTCCDYQPAILARNILLYVLVVENEPTDSIWNIYYHFLFDKTSSAILVRYCEALLACSNTAEEWHQSKYGSWLKVLDTNTLAEVREYWRSYVKFQHIDSSKEVLFRKQFKELGVDNNDKYSTNWGASRSAAPLALQAVPAVSDLFSQFWKTGTTFQNADELRSATLMNPSFVYSVDGEKFAPHYGTFPLQSFHLAAAFAPNPSLSAPVGSTERVVHTARDEFRTWCARFRGVLSAQGNPSVVIRFYAGDALAFCSGLSYVSTTGDHLAPFYACQWRSRPVTLDQLTATDCPTSFDVIDTSNLTDHLGLVNILLAGEPLLKKQPSRSSIMYTETLLPLGENAATSFVDRICGDPQVMAVLLGIVPRPLLTGYQANSYGHELLHNSISKGKQYHERVSWVRSTDGDGLVEEPIFTRIASNVDEVAGLLFDLYDKILDFEHVDLADLSRVLSGRGTQRTEADLEVQENILYNRRTFASLLKHVQRRIAYPDSDWEKAVDLFIIKIQRDASRIVGMNFIQDLCLQLHMQGVYSTNMLKPDWADFPGVTPPPREIFRHWDLIPPVVYLTLTVPHRALRPFRGRTLMTSPRLQIHIDTGEGHQNAFASIHAAPGRVDASVDPPVLSEAAGDFRDAPSLVFSCWIPAWLLTFHRSKRKNPTISAELPIEGGEVAHVELKSLDNVAVGVNLENNRISTFCGRLDFRDEEAKAALSQAAAVSAEQIGPCTMRVSVGRFQHTLSYPFPIIGDQRKLRIARKSHYVEVIVPPSGALAPRGYLINPFPVISSPSLRTWGVHTVNLDILPALHIHPGYQMDWLSVHAALQMSDRERTMRATKTGKDDALMNVKDSMHALLMLFTGLQGGTCIRAFALSEPDEVDIHTLLFVDKLRLDLAAFTVVADAAVIPLETNLFPHIEPGLQVLMRHGQGNLSKVTTGRVEAEAWRKMLPAAVERCRTWAHKPTCEYDGPSGSSAQTTIPISTALDGPCLCTCGRGVTFDSFTNLDTMPWWTHLRPFATRAALGPLFAVSYVEPVASSMQEAGKHAYAQTCDACGGSGTPKLLVCGRCKAAKYCSAACQKADWKKRHKQECKA
ncbi:hypothetical protein GLOTRDRAFT_128021 [Gloeophyllum trabeum ATCC 11539]|uniref:MYND-type domain-containing protein n=1 Tax=Gloeophyllum trabeum (strain ATCC 11539 / FP-39264 / Madison 617) TaxID=670483 RepID=S7RSL7_GLOTA|nr:uncharacterized protein GLOTRDRAFT_128021 [Gloeophyllum trabeum ATCC 11539]EPQ57665.1 hypothetical protein GLOTRDRAFT_128021 [Gloeophyllum trabeum ATCC 11539]